ncbi:MAG: acyl-ACP--UDP-N-acetylglucosamine O-acyltransferase, partial [Ignavibacteria bacterium]
RIADNVKIFHGGSIASHPHSVGFADEVSTVEIGEGTLIKEFSTISRATKYSHRTIVGKDCYIMNYVHVAHDNRIGDNVVLTNGVGLGGHVSIGSHTTIGGLVGVHQFVHIGEYVMVESNTKVTKDIPPYILVGRTPQRFMGINYIGLKRKGFSGEVINQIKDAYRIVYSKDLNFKDSLKKLTDEMEMTPEIKNIYDFITKSERGILSK